MTQPEPNVEVEEDRRIPDCGCGKHKEEPPDYRAAAKAARSLHDQFIANYLSGLKELAGREFTENERHSVGQLAEERWTQFYGGCFTRWVEDVPLLAVTHLPSDLFLLWREYWGRAEK